MQVSSRNASSRQTTALATVDHHHIRPVVEAIGLQGTAALVTQCTEINAISLGPGPTPETRRMISPSP